MAVIDVSNLMVTKDGMIGIGGIVIDELDNGREKRIVQFLPGWQDETIVEFDDGTFADPHDHDAYFHYSIKMKHDES